MTPRHALRRSPGPVLAITALVVLLLAGTTAAETLVTDPPAEPPVEPLAPPTTAPPTTGPPPTTAAPATTQPPSTTAPPPTTVVSTTAVPPPPGPVASAAPEVGVSPLVISAFPELQVVALGDTAFFEVFVDNNGDVPVEQVSVEAGPYTDCEADLGTIADGDFGFYECEIQNVTAGFTVTFTVTGVPQIGVVPLSGPEGGVGTVTDSTTADVLLAAIDVQKGPDPTVVDEDGDATFDIEITNVGDVYLFNVETIDDAVPDCDRSYVNVGFDSDLEPGESVTYSCTDTDVLEPYLNQIAVFAASSFDEGSFVEVSDEDLAQVVLDGGEPGEPSISVSKTPDLQTVAFLGVATFDITVTNDGEVPLSNLAVDDPLTEDCDRTWAQLNGGEPLFPDDEITYSCSTDALTEGFTNTATATAVAGETGVQASDTAVVEVDAPPEPSVQIQKTALNPDVVPGEDAQFLIQVTNDGDGPLSDLVVTDPLAPDCDRDFAAAFGSGGLAEDGSRSYTCVAEFGTDFDDDVVNVASVAGSGDLAGEPVPVSDQDSAAVNVRFPGLRITKEALPPVVEVGGDTTFRVVVTNTGELGLDVVVTDQVAPGCARDLGRLAPGARRVITCELTGLTESIVNVAVATGARDFGDEEEELSGVVTVVAASNAAAVTVVPPGVDPPPPPPTPPAPPTITVVTPGPVPSAPSVGDPSTTTTTTSVPDADGDPVVPVSVDDPVTVLTGSFVRLEGDAPVDCPLVLRLDGEEVDRADGGSGFTFDLPTAGLAAGAYQAEVTCLDGTPIWSREFRVVGLSSPRSATQPILIFVALLVALALVALFGARPAPTEQSTDQPPEGPT